MKKIEEMSLLEKVGQLMILGFKDEELDGMLDLINTYKVGNVILFTRNGKDAKQLFTLNQKLQKYALEKLDTPLLISSDQEGGMVTRILKNATFFPGNMTVAAANNPEYATLIGDMMGEELKNIGINMNLAPVLDVNNNIANPVIGVRSYSDNPEVVAELGINYINGLQKHRVLATGKHFPGHGDTSVDSHLDLTTVKHDKERLNSVELYPFKKAFDAKLGAIMSAHVLFPAYEENNLPATLSRNVLTNLLRNELGFEGLIVTDCMEMKAIDTYFTTEKAVVKAIEAGANLVCISHTRSRQIDAINEVIKAVEEGHLDIKIIDEAVERVLAYKATILDDVVEFTNKKEISDTVNAKSHLELAQKVMDDALTQVNGEAFVDGGKVLFIAPKPAVTTIADDEVEQKSLVDLIKKEFPHWTVKQLEVSPNEENTKYILENVADFDKIVFCTYNANIYKKQLELLQLVKAQNKNIHVIALRNPYDLMSLDLPSVCVYEYTPISLNTVVKYLHGNLAPKGKLPVKF